MSLSQTIEENLFLIDQTLEELLEIQADFAADLIEKEIRLMRTQGLTDDAITQVLEADFAAKGRIFGQIDNAVRGQVVGSIIESSNMAQNVVYTDAGVGDERIWIVVNLGPNASANPCPDCITRQGRVEPMQIWEIVGLPGSGWSVCKQFCYCILGIPELAMDRVDII